MYDFIKWGIVLNDNQSVLSGPDIRISKQASGFLELDLFFFSTTTSPGHRFEPLCAWAHGGLCSGSGRRKLFRRHSLGYFLSPSGLVSCKKEEEEH